ncbi:MAG: MATE family efflux transporter [Lachnospiraceae bacterium]|nr:MATE family efflux transporter [Lachnospiraceae bacterium]
MAAHIKEMTEGKPSKLILTFALSLTLGNVFQQLYTVVDTMVVGKYLGVDALAAVGAAEWMHWLFLGVIEGLAQGFAILMAQEFGAKQLDSLRKVIGNAIMLSLFSAVLLLCAGQIFCEPILRLLRTPDTILGDTLLYLRIIFIGIPVVLAYNLLAGILRSLGDSKTPLHAMVVAALINIGLDLIFVMVFQWGIAGAAAATVIAQGISSLYCFYHIRKIDFILLKKEDYIPDSNLVGKLFYLGLPMAFQNAIISVGGMIVQSVVNGFGVIFIAGFTATNKLYGLLEIAAISYGYAMVTYVGQNLGAGKYDRIRSGMRAAVGISLATSAVIAAVMLIFGRNILGLFISGTPEVAEQTMQIAYFYLAVMSVCLPILYILHVTRSAIQGMGNTVLPMVSGIVEFLMRTLTALLLPLAVGKTGIFFAEIAAWTGADVVLVISYFVVLHRLPGKERAA